MITLSFGYKKPQSGDRGTVVFPALEDNIQRQNDHTHDGINSAPIPGSSIVGLPVTLLPAGWVATVDGNYRQIMTVPAGYNFDAQSITVRTLVGEYVWAKIEKLSTTQAYIYTNDASVTFVCVVGG
jgi:hypothetical protein